MASILAGFLRGQHISLADGHVDLQRNHLRLPQEGMPVLRRLPGEIGAHERIGILGRA